MGYKKNKHPLGLWVRLLLALLLLAIAIVSWITKFQEGFVIAFIGLLATIGQWLLPIKDDTVPSQAKPTQNTKALFHVNEPLQDLDDFFGRESIRSTLVERTYRTASTSIVGPPRVGKTWLISYLALIAPHQFKQSFPLISYIDPRLPRCATFRLSIVGALIDFGVPLQGNETMNDMLIKLQDKVQDLRSRGVIPILCIDKFERFCMSSDFSLGVLESLRAIAGRGLVLIISSREPLNDTLMKAVGKQGYDSPFSNIFLQLTLEPFNAKEAEDFIHNKGIQAELTRREKEVLLKYGQKGNKQWPPLRLQLLGQLLAKEKDGSNYHLEDPSYLLDFLNRFESNYQNAGG